MRKEYILEVDLTDAAQEKFGGKKRSDLKDSDFLFPDTRSYPIKTAQDVRDAINNYGRGNHGLSYEQFIHKLWQKAKSKGLQSGVPEATRKKYNLS